MGSLTNPELEKRLFTLEYNNHRELEYRLVKNNISLKLFRV